MSTVLNLGNHYQAAGTQKYGGNGGIWARGYQTSQALLTNVAYWDNSSVYPITAVGTGTFTISNTTPPPIASQGSVFSPTDTASQIPKVGENRSYAIISGGASANGGASIPINWSLSSDGTTGVASIVLRSPAGTAVAGKIKLRSSVGNESVFAFTMVANTNWQTFTWTPQVSGNGVTLTGTPVYTTLTVAEITLDATSTIIEASMSSSANNQMCIIGTPFAISFRNVDAADFKRGMESAIREAYQQQYAKTATGKKPTFEVTCTLQNDFIKGLFNGTIAKNGSYYKPTTINSEIVGKKAVTSGAITLPAGLKTPFVEVRFGDNEFLQQWTGLLATLPAKGYYFYTLTTLTVGSSYEGRIPNIIIDDLITGDYIEDLGLQLGYYVRIDEKQITLDGQGEKNRQLPRAILEMAETSTDNANDKVKYTFAILPSGSDFKYYQESVN